MRRITVFLSAILALGNDEVWHLRAEPAPVPLWVKPAVTEIAAGVWRLRYGQPEKFTPESMRAAPARMEGFKSLPVPGGTPLAWGDIRCRITPTRTVVYIPCDDASEKIYGFGLDPEAYQQNGLTKTLTMSAAVVGKTGAGHGPVPFYLSTKGYGVYVDTARVPTVQVARLAPNTGFAPKPDSGDAPKTSEAELYAPRPARGGREVIFDLPGAGSGVDVYIFGGPSMREAVQRYNLFAGGGAVPPLWGLGLKFRTYTRADQATVLKSARALRAMKIPCDMIGLEPGWQSRSYSCSFTWSPERFPTPETMLQELHESGFKVNLWEHAYIHPTSPMYPALKTRAGDYLVWSGLVVDFADPEAARIFSDFHEQHLVSLGILGFKGDECDKQPFSDATPFNYPYSTAFPSGIDGDQMTQLYG